MNWIDVKLEPPTEEDTYIVKTESSYQAHPSRYIVVRENVMKVNLRINEKGELSWGCNNQIVTHYLK